MSGNLQYRLLVAVASVAIAGFGVLLYGYAVLDWRLGDVGHELGSLVGSNAVVEDSSGRTVAWSAEFEATDVDAIDIDGQDIDVRVVAWEGSVVRVQALLSGSASDSSTFEAFASRDTRGHLRVVGRPRGRSAVGMTGNAEFTISLPRALPVVVKLGRGNLTLRSLDDTVSAEIGVGEIRAGDIRGAIDLVVDQGDIYVEGCRTRGSIRCTRGRAHLELNEGDVTVTALGNITARNHFGSITATTSLGSIDVDLVGELQPATLSSDSGSIRVQLLNNARTSLSVETAPGRIVSTLPLDSIPPEAASGGILHATMNGGGAPLTIRSRQGLIVLTLYRSTRDERVDDTSSPPPE